MTALWGECCYHPYPISLDEENEIWKVSYFAKVTKSGNYRNSTQATYLSDQIRSDQSLSHVRLFVTPWIAACQASLSITNSRSSLRLTSIESVMPSSHLILWSPLLLLPPIPPSIRVFFNESTLCMRWPLKTSKFMKVLHNNWLYSVSFTKELIFQMFLLRYFIHFLDLFICLLCHHSFSFCLKCFPSLREPSTSKY